MKFLSTIFEKRKLIPKTLISPGFIALTLVLSCIYFAFQLFYLDSKIEWFYVPIYLFMIAQLWNFFYELVLYFKMISMKITDYCIPSDTELTDYPSLAFIIPSYHEPFDVCKMTFDSILNTPYKGKKEIIVVDNSRNTEAEDFQKWKKYVEAHQTGLDNVTVQFFHNKETAGLKPGNLDLAIQNIGDSEYIVVLDVDSTLPRDQKLLDDSIKQFQLDPKLGWVQFKTVSTNHHFNACGQAIGISQTLLRLLCFARSFGGLTLFYGHNAIWRKSCLVKLGPWLEHYRGQVMVTEDILKCIRAYTKGYYGITRTIKTGEWVPTSLEALESMWMRWTYGTCQVISKYFSRIVTSKKMLPIEKIDLIQHMIVYWARAFVLPFSALIHFFYPPQLVGLFIIVSFLLPLGVSGAAIYRHHLVHVAMSPLDKLRYLYCALFIIPVFVYAAQLKGVANFMLRKPQGWKVTNKNVENIQSWPAILSNKLYYLILASIFLLSSIASWLINYNGDLWAILNYLPLLFFTVNLFLAIFIFGKEGRTGKNDIALATIDTSELEFLPQAHVPASHIQPVGDESEYQKPPHADSPGFVKKGS